MAPVPVHIIPRDIFISSLAMVRHERVLLGAWRAMRPIRLGYGGSDVDAAVICESSR